MTRRRLFFDIETSPNIAWIWESGYQINVPASNIIHERAIMCIGYKWEGESKVHMLTWDDKHSDKEMLKQFIEVMDSAEEVVGHNGDGFDIPWVRTRCVIHGLPMMPSYISIDTLKNARRYFKFNANNLDYLCKVLGLGSKKKVEFEDWLAVAMHSDKKVFKKIQEYCKHDVKLLEALYHRLDNYVPAKIRANQNYASCPKCSSTNVRPNQKYITAGGTHKTTLRCYDCGKFHTLATSKFEKAKK